MSKDVRTSLAQEENFAGGLVDKIDAIGLLVRKHFCALSAAGQVGLKVGGSHPPVLKSKPMAVHRDDSWSKRAGAALAALRRWKEVKQSFMDIGFEAPFDGYLAVRGGSDRHRRPLGSFVDRNLFTFLDGSTDLEGTCHGTKKLIGTFTRPVDRVGGNTDSHPHSRVRPSGPPEASVPKKTPETGRNSLVKRP